MEAERSITIEQSPPSFSSRELENPTTSVNYSGRAWDVITGVCGGILDVPGQGDVLDGIHNGDGLHKLAKLTHFVQMAVGYGRGNIHSFSTLQKYCQYTMTVLDGVRTVTESRMYFFFHAKVANGDANPAPEPKSLSERILGQMLRNDWKAGYLGSIAGNIGLLVVNVASTIDLIRDVNLIDSGALAASIGSFKIYGVAVFGIVNAVTLVQVIQYSLIASLVCLSVDTMHKYAQGKGTAPGSALKLVTMGAEIALQYYSISYPDAITFKYIFLGIASASTGLISQFVNTPSMKNLYQRMGNWNGIPI